MCFRRGPKCGQSSTTELPDFMAQLREQKGMGARALEFAILTAARTGEVLGATPNEIDPGEKVWIVPSNRMKAGREHRVPLSARALAIVRDATAFKVAGAPKTSAPDAGSQTAAGAFIFPGRRKGRPLAKMAMAVVLKRMGRGDITVHGFRSTFRDWAAERTNFPKEVVEKALAHAVGDKVEAAYRRGDLFEKRLLLMRQWATYCMSAPTAAGDNLQKHQQFHACHSSQSVAGRLWQRGICPGASVATLPFRE
jgi:integrase